MVVLFRDALLPRPEKGPGTKAGKERVLYYLQAHARNEPIILQLDARLDIYVNKGNLETQAKNRIHV